MRDADVEWAQNVVDRWSTKKGVPSPKVMSVPTSGEIKLSGYQDSTIIVNGRSWDRLELAGKLLLLALPFGHHVQAVSETVPDDNEIRDMTRELVVIEVELWSDATGVQMTRLMNMKSISKLLSLQNAGPAAR